MGSKLKPERRGRRGPASSRGVPKPFVQYEQPSLGPTLQAKSALLITARAEGAGAHRFSVACADS
eukprot:1358472-Heterocapsa_arctica.AAC.1